MKKLLKFIYSFTIVFLTGVISSYFTRFGMENWYHEAVPSAFTPPDAVFPIVWSILYILLALSYAIILQIPKSKETLEANRLFLSQLLLQILWCFTFFRMGQLGFGLLIILLMLWLTKIMLRVFSAINRQAGLLLYPYFLWLAYASLLNLFFVINNGIIIEI